MPNIKWILRKKGVKPFAYLRDYSISKNEVTVTYTDQTAKKFETKLDATYEAISLLDKTNIVWEAVAITEEENNAEKTF